MSKYVFIMGAGASRDAGGPLMWDFLDKAEDLRRNPSEPEKQAFDLTFEAVYELSRAQSKTAIDVDNIESVYGAFEMAALTGRLGELDPEVVPLLAPSIRKVITRTLETNIRFPVTDRKYLSAPRPYDSLGEALRERVVPFGGPTRGDFTFITFNYDTCIETMLWRNNIAYEYCLDGEPSHPDMAILLKLHGSLNWIREDDDAKVTSVDPALLLNKSYFTESKYMLLEWSRILKAGRTDEHGQLKTFDPVIVPPSWSKGEHHRQIQNVWKRAARELTDAEHLYFIGYSLPESDSFFRFLFALGTTGPSRIRSIRVYDPDSSGAVKQRYERMLGPQTQGRFVYQPLTFPDAIGDIIGSLPTST